MLEDKLIIIGGRLLENKRDKVVARSRTKGGRWLQV